MKKIIFIFFVLIITKLYNAPCPEEDYPNIKYGPLESINFCLSELGSGECEGCCITVYFYKRWIAAYNYLDVMMDYVSPHQTEDCYLCYRRYAQDIIEAAHKRILENYAFDYGLTNGMSNVHHITLRAGCARIADPPLSYEVVCSVEVNSCCHLNYEVVIEEYGKITRYSNNFGLRYFSNPPNCTYPCYIKCGFVANLNLFSSHPRIGDHIKAYDISNINDNNNIVTYDDVITIYLDNNYAGNVNFDFFNEIGVKITSILFYKTKENVEYQLNISMLKNGINFIRMKMNDEFKIIKLIKLSN